ncbi:hypothetical protein ETU09_09635 [Apibacter muscae]|uniref:Gp5/Type VI secretion system Vgr protein OB-fold domain-containing protein n=1 Tax=Apibacter muscae TaxID=2509004 RepID=A0A563D9N8_9FLAO|nr:phage baseplate assembly protein V [Apibacter muscae]TWP26812.1 hypothetical protein ETU09_09635 [Apibacter muscae]
MSKSKPNPDKNSAIKLSDASREISKTKKVNLLDEFDSNEVPPIKNIIPGDIYSLPNGLLTEEQYAQYKGLNSLIATYGGDPEKNLANSHIVFSKIFIGGERVLADSHFEVKIEQKVAEHDTFIIRCFSDAIEDPKAYPLEKARNFLGKRATIQFMQFGSATLVYTGIITDIANVRENGESQLVFTGKSPTILLENGLDCQSFENLDLKEIVTKATTEYPTDLVQLDLQPLLTDRLLYTVQYRESDWNFIKRLATRYGEWLYYNGQQIVLGPYRGKTWELVEEQDVYDSTLRMKLMPQKFSYTAYDAKQAETYTINSQSVRLSRRLVNPFQQHALDASEGIYSKVASSLYNHSLLEGGPSELERAVKKQKQRRQNVFYMEAKTNNPNLKVGDNVKLKAWMPGHSIFKNGEVPLETYRIIEIKHYQDITEGYYNHIVAIPKDNEVPPYMDEDAFPACEEQSAIVTDNNDPQGMSRIRVQFPWQKPFNGQTPWIRSITPYAGEGKGMHVVPEIGEEVIVSFENGNAEKPVSLGAMFNGKGKSGHGGAGNYMKGLTTATGSNLTFNDQKGDMTLADKGGASMNFDGAGNATTNANQTHAVNAGSNANTSVGGDASTLKMDASGNITLEGNTNITLKVGGNTIVIDGSGITMTSNSGNIQTISNTGSITALAANSIMMSSNKTIIQGNRAALKGNQILLEGASSIKCVSPDTDIF